MVAVIGTTVCVKNTIFPTSGTTVTAAKKMVSVAPNMVCKVLFIGPISIYFKTISIISSIMPVLGFSLMRPISLPSREKMNVGTFSTSISST